MSKGHALVEFTGGFNLFKSLSGDLESKQNLIQVIVGNSLHTLNSHAKTNFVKPMFHVCAQRSCLVCVNFLYTAYLQTRDSSDWSVL